MSISQTVQSRIDTLPPGQVFGYRDLPNYIEAPLAVAQTMSRMVSSGRVKRLSKGKFYIPRKGIMGPRKPSDSALVRSVLYDGERLRGYITGLALFNRSEAERARLVELALEYDTPRVRALLGLILDSGVQGARFRRGRIRALSAMTARGTCDP